MAFNRDEHKKEWNRARQNKTVTLIGRWKMMKGCAHCGYKGHPSALVLDHVDPATKDRSKRAGGRAYNPLWSRARIKQELAKCQVLCANCSNIRTHEEKHYAYRQPKFTGPN